MVILEVETLGLTAKYTWYVCYSIDAYCSFKIHLGQYFRRLIFMPPWQIIKICPCLSVRPSVRNALWYRVCVINSSHSFQWIFLKPCIPVVDILKMCMWVFGGARINFDRITALVILGNFCIVGYGVCVINSSYSFQWIILKPCILIVDILKMCMWIFAGEKIIFDKIMAFWT